MHVLRGFILQLALLLSADYALAQAFSPADIVNHTVTLTQPVHFANPDGNDVLVPAGGYWVVAQEDSLGMLSLDSGEVYTLRAAAGEHDSEIFAELAVSTAGTDEQPDAHFISYLFVDGSALTAEGSYSGIQARGLLDDAKRRAAAAALANARRQAAAAKNRALAQAEAAAIEARRRAEQAAANLQNLAQDFLGLTCEDKFAAVGIVTEQLAAKIQADQNASIARTKSSAPLVQEVMERIVEEALKSDRPMVDAAIRIADKLRDPRRRDELERLITNATCGVEPDATAEQILATANAVYQAAQPATQDISTRGVRDFTDENFTLSFDVSLGATLPPLKKYRSTTGAGGVGVAVGPRGDPPCTNPNLSRACVRAYFYRHIGGSTPETGVALPLAVGVWRVNPSGLQGRYTNLGGGMSFETLAGIYAAATTTATAATGGAAAPATLGTIAGMTGIGFDVALDKNLATFIECAMANPDDYWTTCRGRPRAIGLIVNVGLSVSVAPLGVHRVSGSTWTWWWQNGQMTDLQGPTKLWKDAIDYVVSR